MSHSSPSPLRVALVGYGNAGRIFHAPLVSGVPGLVLACIVSSKPEAVAADWPGVRTVATPQQAFADADIDLVVIATGNGSHHPLAKAALLAGKHVVVDKPFTVSLAEAEDLLAVARAQQRVVTVFQNRRWDADFLALRQVLASGQLGRVVFFESHFDRYRPEVPNRWRDDDLPGSGLWFDLGAHLVDQALQLFGCPDDLQLDLARQRDGARTNDYFHAQLRYGSRDPALRVVLHASALVPALGPRFVVHGTLGSFVKYGLDPQEDALKAGGRPHWGALEGWGRDLQVGQVVRHVDGQARAEAAPDVAGNYLAFYAQLLAHLRGQGPVPVSAAEAHRVMALLSRGELSARQGRRIDTTDLSPG
ncbi:oxidoreductase [Rhodoferax koreense]|uniref:Oxidoreductase n=1 Tax=Rhodoferax koreensis TaxID=1842727 RepID=A0A1P8JX91_9BURK|nr:oxidoreductase [Rhodoferax koreense]APW38358.1 oxidoreductase [Rhodoferax koreense]